MQLCQLGGLAMAASGAVNAVPGAAVLKSLQIQMPWLELIATACCKHLLEVWGGEVILM